VGGGRCPVVNYSGGTEVSGGIVASTVITRRSRRASPARSRAWTRRGRRGRLTGARPGRRAGGPPAVARHGARLLAGARAVPRGVLVAAARHVGPRRLGLIDADGFWYIHGRSDDTIKIAGKRLGPAEVESAAVTHPARRGGRRHRCPRRDQRPGAGRFLHAEAGPPRERLLRRAVADAVVAGLGKSLKPERVLFVGEVPKTRSGKVMRRLIRAVHLGKEPGDLSALENAAALDAIRAAR